MLEVSLTEDEMLAMSLKEPMTTILEKQETWEDSDSSKDFLDIFNGSYCPSVIYLCIVECLTFWPLFVLLEKRLRTRWVEQSSVSCLRRGKNSSHCQGIPPLFDLQ